MAVTKEPGYIELKNVNETEQYLLQLDPSEISSKFMYEHIINSWLSPCNLNYFPIKGGGQGELGSKVEFYFFVVPYQKRNVRNRDFCQKWKNNVFIQLRNLKNT